MVRTKIEINVSALRQRTKSMNMIIGSNTTCEDVLRKVLEKFHMRESPTKYQLLAVAKNNAGSQGRVLEHGDHPGHILQQVPQSPLQFVVGVASYAPLGHSLTSPKSQKPASKLIRVHHQLQRGAVQSFTSLIVSPTMSGKEMLELAVSKATPSEPASGYCLVLVTPQGDIPIQSDEFPYSMTSSSSRFELRKKKGFSPPSLRSTVPYPSLPHSLLSPVPHPMNGQPPKLSNSQLLQGKLRLHGELIDALHKLAAQSKAGDLFESPADMKSREVVLEQALVEQNQIMDVMQELVSTLESENKLCRGSLDSQSVLSSNWEAKAKQMEKEMAQRTRQLPTVPSHQDLKIAELRKQLEDKNHTILSLQSRLRNESSSVESSLMAKLFSARTKLEAERVHCIELEEQLSQIKDDFAHLKGKVADNYSHLISKESEILHLKHQMKTLQNFELQQQDLVMKQRGSLAKKELQLSSLIRALNKEKKVADQLRRFHASSSNSQSLLSGLADSGSNNGSLDVVYPKLQVSLFEQITGRETCSIELTRTSKDTELGFSFSKVDLPVSSRVPCLIVKAVKEESQAAAWLRPGDELIEVNGVLCRSPQQSRAVRMLGEAVGLLKIVVARESGAFMSKPLGHSTPMRQPPGLTDSSNRTALWATALSPSNGATFESFAVESMLSGSGATPKYITVPDIYAISVAKDSEGGSVNDDLAGNDTTEVSNLQVAGGQQSPTVSKSASSTAGSESLMTFSSKDDVSCKKLQGEVMELRDQLDESEHIRVGLESELSSTQEEADHLQEEYELTKAENRELREEVGTYEAEVVEIRQHISALQSALVTLEAQVTDEQQKLATMENHHRVISGELAEARDAASIAIEAKEKLGLALEHSKAELEQREDKDSQLRELKLDNVRLVSDVARMGGETSELRNTLGESKRSSEETIIGLRQELKQVKSQLELAREISEKTTLSSQEEYQHLTTQLKSAKSLLMEAEMKESQQIVEGRYLKQAADLANTQLKTLEADHQKKKEELGLFKQEAERRTVEMESLNISLRGTQMKLEAKQQMVVRLQGEVDNSRRASSKLRNENLRLNEAVKKLEIELRAASAEEERLEEKLEASIAEKDEMFQQLEKSYEESTELTLTLEGLSAQMEEQESLKTREQNAKEDEMIKSLKLSETKLQQQLDISKKKAELLSEQTSKLRSEIKLLESKCERSVKDIAQLKTENEQLSAAKDNTHEQLVHLQESHGKLKEEMEKRRLAEDYVQAMLAQAQEQAIVERERSHETKQKISELNSELKAALEGKKRNEDMVASLEFLQTQDQTKLEQMKQSINSKEKEVQQLNEQVENVNSLLQKSKLELSNLTSANVSLEQQLKKGSQEQMEEVRDLKDKLAVGERKSARLNDELKAQEAMSEILHSKIEHLGELVEKMSQDKQLMEKAIEESEKGKEGLQVENKQLQSRATSLRVELDRLTVSSDSMSSESAGLRQQLRQNEKDIDQATAQLNAAEMNLEVTTRALRESERVNSAQSEKLDDLEARYKSSQSNLEGLKTTVEEKSMEFLEQEEELSKVKTALELRQNECKSLQESLIALHMTVEDLRRSASDSEEEKNQLISDIAKLDEGREKLQGSLEELEKEKGSMLAKKSDEIKEHQEEIERLQVAGKAHVEEAAGLKVSHQEAKMTISQLLSAQEELKKSVSKLGNEKDAEIIKLQEKLQEMKPMLSKVTDDLDSSLKSEAFLRDEVVKLEQTQAELQVQVEQEIRKSKELQDEIELLTVTKKEIGELNEKVTALGESLGDKTKKLLESENVCQATESELKNLNSENKDLLEKALELSDLKISMAEQSENMEAMRKKLEEGVASHKQLLEERDQLLSRVREFELRNHASLEKPKPTIEPVTAVDKLVQLVEEKEVCMSRMQAYTDNLILNVMMHAPSLLEKL